MIDKKREFDLSEERFPGGRCVTRLTSGRILEPVYISDNLPAMLFMDRETFTSQADGDLYNVINQDDREFCRAAIDRALGEKRVFDIAFRFAPPQGRSLWVNANCVIREIEGEIYIYASYTDASAAFRVREELAVSEQRLRSATEGAELAVWEYDIPGHRIIAANNGLFRYGLPDMIEDVPATLLDPLEPDSLRDFKHLYQKVESGVRKCSADIWFKAEHRGRPWCERLTYDVVTDSAGRPVKAYGIGREVTSEKMEERRYRALLRDMLEVNPEALCFFYLNLTRNRCGEGQGTSLYAQGKLRAKTAEELFENIIDLAVSREDKEKLTRKLNRESLINGFIEGEETIHVDYKRKNNDEGDTIWARSFVRMLRNPGTNDIEAIIYSVDISDSVRQEMMIQTIIREEFDSLAIVNAKTGYLTFYHINEEARETTPTKETDYDADIRYAIAIVDPEHAEFDFESTCLDRIKEELETKQVYSFSYSLKGGKARKALKFCYISPEKEDIIFIRTDITEEFQESQRHLEEVNAALLKARRANSAKTDFLSRMSHDIRTPLNGIIGMTYIASEQENPAETRECLAKIDTSSKFLLGLVNDILDMTKAESGKIELRTEPYVFKDFITYLDAVIRPQCEVKNLKFKIDADAAPDKAIVADPLRINQIFFNLLSNAVKFTPEGGEILYRQRETMLENGKIRLKSEVIDNGSGMSEEFQKHLFEPFTQESRHDIRDSGGSGLGLSIVRKLVDLMGGTISVKSRVGAGTVFTIIAEFDCVPVSELPARGFHTDGTEEAGSLRNRNILLCEDHPMNQEIAETLLRSRGAYVTTAEDGARGVEVFRAAPEGFFDAVLMDIHMPVMNGYEAARHIRAINRPDARAVPIIAMTADAFEEDEKMCLEAGMNARIAKPVEPEILFRTLQNYINEGKKNEA